MVVVVVVEGGGVCVYGWWWWWWFGGGRVGEGVCVDISDDFNQSRAGARGLTHFLCSEGMALSSCTR